MNWTIFYYNEKVKAEIFLWPSTVLADFRRLLTLLEENGADLRMPHSRAMGSGLFELRCKGSDGIARIFYGYMSNKRIIILHSFIKKTQETPHRELNIAQTRLREIQENDY